jgi:hypothetical protein
MKKIETKFPINKPKATKKKYQNVNKEDFAIDGGYVV